MTSPRPITCRREIDCSRNIPPPSDVTIERIADVRGCHVPFDPDGHLPQPVSCPREKP
jgi:hypothetical protein